MNLEFLIRRYFYKLLRIHLKISTFRSGTVYKPRRQVKGEGVAQMSTLLNEIYLVKRSMKGEGVKMPQILSTWFVHSPKAYIFICRLAWGRGGGEFSCYRFIMLNVVYYLSHTL